MPTLRGLSLSLVNAAEQSTKAGAENIKTEWTTWSLTVDYIQIPTEREAKKEEATADSQEIKASKSTYIVRGKLEPRGGRRESTTSPPLTGWSMKVSEERKKE